MVRGRTPCLWISRQARRCGCSTWAQYRNARGILRQEGHDQGCVFAFERSGLFSELCANVALNALVNVITASRLWETDRGDSAADVQSATEHEFGAVSVMGHGAGEPVDVVRIDDLRLGRVT